MKKFHSEIASEFILLGLYIRRWLIEVRIGYLRGSISLLETEQKLESKKAELGSDNGRHRQAVSELSLARGALVSLASKLDGLDGKIKKREKPVKPQLGRAS